MTILLCLLPYCNNSFISGIASVSSPSLTCSMFLLFSSWEIIIVLCPSFFCRRLAIVDFPLPEFPLKIISLPISLCINLHYSFNTCFGIRSVIRFSAFNDINSLRLTHLYAMVSPGCNLMLSFSQSVTHKNSTYIVLLSESRPISSNLSALMPVSSYSSLKAQSKDVSPRKADPPAVASHIPP